MEVEFSPLKLRAWWERQTFEFVMSMVMVVFRVCRNSLGHGA